MIYLKYKILHKYKLNTIMFESLTNRMNNLFEKINDNKYFVGIMMIILNIGAKYINIDLGNYETSFLTSRVLGYLLVFVIVFIATRDVKVAVIVSILFCVIFMELLHEKSSYSILPDEIKDLDFNKDGVISSEEIERAYNILKQSGKIKSNNLDTINSTTT